MTRNPRRQGPRPSKTARDAAQLGAVRRLQVSTEHPALLVASLLGLLLLSAVTFMLSFAALAEIAPWANIMHRLAWGLPVFVDGAIVVYTLAVIIQKGRGEKAAAANVFLVLFTAVSVVANGSHAFSAGDPNDWRTWFGTAIAALPPIGQYAATHTIAKILILPPQAVPVVDRAGELERAEQERTQLERTQLERTEQERTQLERAEQERAEQERAQLERAQLERAAQERAAQERAEQERARTGVSQPRVTATSPDEEERNRRIVELGEEGLSAAKIAPLAGTSESTVKRVLRRHRAEQTEQTEQAEQAAASGRELVAA